MRKLHLCVLVDTETGRPVGLRWLTYETAERLLQGNSKYIPEEPKEPHCKVIIYKTK